MAIVDAPVEFIEEVCGIYFRSIVLRNVGDRVSQHVHDMDHATYIGSGAVKFWAGGKFIGLIHAGRAVAVEAGKYHEFEAVIAPARLTCVHDAKSAMAIKERGL